MFIDMQYCVVISKGSDGTSVKLLDGARKQISNCIQFSLRECVGVSYLQMNVAGQDIDLFWSCKNFRLAESD